MARPARGRVNGGACPACGGELRPWRSAPASEPADARTFALARCLRCASAATLGDPPGPEAYEAGTYAPRPPRARALLAALQRATVAQPARLLAAAGPPPPARVLDVGAGQGRLVAELRRRGYDARGIDPSARSAGLAQAARRAVKRAAIAEHDDADLGAVVLWHVLEHLDEPAPALERVTSWMAADGRALIGVPNIASLQARIAGPGWLHLDLPRHRTHFTPAGLAALLERAGLRPLRWVHMVWEHNPASMWMALLTRAGMSPGFPFHALKRTAPLRPRDLALTAAGLPLLPPAAALEGAAAAARRGGTVAVVARRR